MPNPNLYGPAMEPDQQLVPEPKWSSAAASVFVWATDQRTPRDEAASDRELRAVERELATALAELASLNDLLEDIPEIFERKFQQRLQPLLAENQSLRHQVLQLEASRSERANPDLLPPAQPSRGERPRLGQVIRLAFGLRDAA
jgi:hypothetical protein